MPDTRSSHAGASLPPQTPTRTLLKTIHRRSSFHPGHRKTSSGSSSNNNARRSDEEDDDEANAPYDLGDQNHDEAAQAPAHADADGEEGTGTATEVIAQEAPLAASSSSAPPQSADEPDTQNRPGAKVTRRASTATATGRKDINRNPRPSKRLSGTAQGLARGHSMGAAAGASTAKGLTWEAAKKLEREFEAQEMLIRGLQSDNERKTVEVEEMRRERRTIYQFLERNHGEDWRILVFGAPAASGSSSSANTAGNRDDDEDHAAAEAFGFPAGAGNSGKIMKLLSGGGAGGSEAGSVRGSPPATKPATPALSAARSGPHRAGSPLKKQAFAASAGAEVGGPDETRADTSFFDATAGVDGPDDADEGFDGGAGQNNDGEDDDEHPATAASAREHTPRLAPRVLPPSGSLASLASRTDVQDISDFLAGPAPRSTPSKDDADDEVFPAAASASMAAAPFSGSHAPTAPAPPTVDTAALQAQIDACRMLIQGFARRNARREVELRELEERARDEADKGREELREGLKSFVKA